MKTLLFVFGTRPEAVKMCPIIKEIKKRGSINATCAVSGQHKELLCDVAKYSDDLCPVVAYLAGVPERANDKHRVFPFRPFEAKVYSEDILLPKKLEATYINFVIMNSEIYK